MEVAQAKLILEAALLSAHQPLSLAELRRLFDDELAGELVRSLLEEIRETWQERAVRLVSLASGWRFQTAPELADFLTRLNADKPPRYSRAVMETLAIVAYRQPVTRGDIEEIRGVTVSTQVIKMLEERGWIEAIGHKDVIGRPELLATTRKFLDDLGLRSLHELPSLDGSKGIADALEQQVIEFDARTGLPAVANPEAVAAPIQATEVATAVAGTAVDEAAAAEPVLVESAATDAAATEIAAGEADEMTPVAAVAIEGMPGHPIDSLAEQPSGDIEAIVQESAHESVTEVIGEELNESNFDMPDTVRESS